MLFFCQIRLTTPFSAGILHAFENQTSYHSLGRLLLAFAGDETIRAYMRKNALPGKNWPEIDSEEKLVSALATIREERMFCGESVLGLGILANPIYQNGEVVAALGMSMPLMDFKGHHKKDAVKAARETASAISNRLISIQTIG